MAIVAITPAGLAAFFCRSSDRRPATRYAAQSERDIADCEQVTLETLAARGGRLKFRNSVYRLGSRLL